MINRQQHFDLINLILSQTQQLLLMDLVVFTTFKNILVVAEILTRFVVYVFLQLKESIGADFIKYTVSYKYIIICCWSIILIFYSFLVRYRRCIITKYHYTIVYIHICIYNLAIFHVQLIYYMCQISTNPFSLCFLSLTFCLNAVTCKSSVFYKV